MKPPLTLGLGAIFVAFVLWFVPSGGAADRNLSDYRVDQWPQNLPLAWRASLEGALGRIPDLSIQEPHAEEAAYRCVQELPWVKPGSVQIARTLPDGIRLSYTPRRPRAILVRRGEHLAVVGRMGVILPDGLQSQILEPLIQIQAPSDYVVPTPGKVISNTYLQSALDATEVAYDLRKDRRLQIARIEPSPDYLTEATKTSVPVSFVLSNGKRIEWGHPVHFATRITPAFAVRLARLNEALKRYPNLEGIQSLNVSSPAMTAIDDMGNPVEFHLLRQ